MFRAEQGNTACHSCCTLPARPPQVASQLEAQSGVRCQDTTVDALQAAVVAGDWERACACLERLRGQLPQGVAAQAQFLLVEHKYREVRRLGGATALLSQSSAVAESWFGLLLGVAGAHPLARSASASAACAAAHCAVLCCATPLAC